MNRDEKAATIEEVAAQIEGADAIFAVDYRGISVPQAAELRGKLREADASFRVVKNRLTKLAAEKAGEERLAALLEGPTALTFVRGDTAQAAKAISTFNKEHEILSFKGGFMDGVDLDAEKFKSIARLPSREVLDGQLAGIVASPLTGLVRGLGSMIQGIALQLGQIAEKGLVSGEAPAEEQTESEETPADPGREAEESPVDGEAESPSEEASQSDSSPTSEGGEAEVAREADAEDEPAAEEAQDQAPEDEPSEEPKTSDDDDNTSEEEE
jgi:large subunit ribosomal protein L10